MAKLTLPSSVEAERSVLGAMLMDPDAVSVGLGTLTEDTFSDVDHRNKLVFRAIKELNEHRNPVDVTTVTDELRNLKLIESAGGVEYLMQLLNSSISSGNIDHYISIVKEQAVLRDFLLKMVKLEEDYSTGQVSDIGEFLANANSELTQIASARKVGEFKTAQDVASTVAVQIRTVSAAKNSQGVTGINTGYHRINEITHGWQKDDMIILAARPSVGKTALAMNFAFNAARFAGKPVAIFSLEMGAPQLMTRMVASRSDIDVSKIQTGMLSPKDEVKISDALREIGALQLYFDDTPGALLGDILTKAQKLKSAHDDLALIVIDYIGLIKTNLKIDSRQQEVTEISHALKDMARQLHVPVIVVCQLSRDVEKTETKVPQLSHLRESGSIEQDADIVMLIYRKDYYTSIGQTISDKGKDWTGDKYTKELEQNRSATPECKSENTSITQILVAKNRNGKTGEATLIFSKNFSRFDDPSPAFEAEQARLNASNGGIEPGDE